MVRIDIVYAGELRCRATHQPSGTELITDAPVDNQGRGASFSPTDLVATALGTCVATTMGIVAARHDLPLTGMRVTVQKTMVADPVRRIGKLTTVIHIPVDPGEEHRQRLETAASHCPVHKSLADSVEAPLVFRWGRA
jgi:putative redox protein